MKQRPRIYYTDTQTALMRERWKAGDTLHQIGKLFDRPHTGDCRCGTNLSIDGMELPASALMYTSPNS